MLWLWPSSNSHTSISPLIGISSTNRPQSIRDTDLDCEPYLSASPSNSNPHPQPGRREAPTKAKVETNFFTHLRQVRGWLPRPFFQPSATQAKWPRKGKRWTGMSDTCPSHQRRRRAIISIRKRLSAPNTGRLTWPMVIQCLLQTRTMPRGNEELNTESRWTSLTQTDQVL